MFCKHALCVICVAALCSTALLAGEPAAIGSGGVQIGTAPPNAKTPVGSVEATPPQAGGIRVQGEDCTDPFVIGSLPFLATGNTCSWQGNYAGPASCTGSEGQTAPDVVYRLDVTSAIAVDIILCGAGTDYDSIVMIYAGSCVNPPLGCADDTCGQVGGPSVLWGVALTPGTYYIVVDGWDTECGNYTLRVEEQQTCSLTCPPGGIPENEPACGPNYVDSYNGGCNSTPAVFRSIACGDTLCGKMGTFLSGTTQRRDTDWMKISPAPTLGTKLVWTTRGEAPFQANIILLGSVVDCPTIGTLTSAVTGQCREQVATWEYRHPGNIAMFAASSVFTGVPCESDYTATLTCEPLAPCDVTCQTGDMLENEPICTDETEDTFNSGCNFAGIGAPPFTAYTLGNWMCATAGTHRFAGANRRDTDWFTFQVTSATTLNVQGTGEMPLQLLLMRAGSQPDVCADYQTVGSGSAAPCQPVSFSYAGATPGEWWLWGGPSIFLGYPCGLVYRARVTAGVPCTRGDTNCDGVVNTFDIDCFVAAVTGGQAGWQACAPSCPPGDFLCRNDVNCDGAVNTFDIDTFVTCVVTGTCPPCP